MKRAKRAFLLPALIAWTTLAGCDGSSPEGNAARPATPDEAKPAPAPPTPLEAACVLLRHLKARIDGVPQRESWPDPTAVRCIDDRVWIVDIDTSRLPGGYPEQMVVEVSATGGHTGEAKR